MDNRIPAKRSLPDKSHMAALPFPDAYDQNIPEANSSFKPPFLLIDIF
jgi:hypothetical protein